MNKDNVKQKVVDALPYIAVFGISALAVYGVTKIVKTVKGLDFPLNFDYSRSEIDWDNFS